MLRIKYEIIIQKSTISKNWKLLNFKSYISVLLATWTQIKWKAYNNTTNINKICCIKSTNKNKWQFFLFADSLQNFFYLN